MTHGRADGGKPKQERQVAASHIMEECLTTDNMAGVAHAVSTILEWDLLNSTFGSRSIGDNSPSSRRTMVDALASRASSLQWQ